MPKPTDTPRRCVFCGVVDHGTASRGGSFAWVNRLALHHRLRASPGRGNGSNAQPEPSEGALIISEQRVLLFDGLDLMSASGSVAFAAVSPPPQPPLAARLAVTSR
jgi:hypothetical protein